MGCDIHLVLEKRDGEKWVGIDTFNGHHRAKWELKDENEYDYSSPVTRTRNYHRFAKLAGVRGYGPNPRGVPDDASDTTRLMVKRWGSDGHSHSWLPMTEAAAIFAATAGDMDEWAAKYPASYFFNVDTSDERTDADDYRIIFWFDN